MDHVQLPKIHRYHEVDRSQRYLESKGNIQKMSGYTRDANELMATSKVVVVVGLCVLVHLTIILEPHYRLQGSC